jgi:murein DD-endopeptidase MepM/ murein hydrolase activator NlpD
MRTTSDLTPIAPLPSRAESASRAAEAERRKLREVAQEFESLLILQMVRQMRRTFLEEPGDSEGFGAETMTETLDVELARTLARQGGLGLASIVERGMEGLVHPGAGAGQNASVDRSAMPVDRLAVPARPAGSRKSVPGPSEVSLPEPAPADASGSVRVQDEVAGAWPTPGAPVPARTSGSVAPAVAMSPLPDSSPDLSLPFEEPPTSSFGWRSDPLHGLRRFHAGLDFRAAYGREVPAAAPGRVVSAGPEGGYGLSVVVQHAGGVQTRYAHLSSISVGVGQELARAQVIGRVGRSGRATGPHLHFEVVLDGQRIDPVRVAARVPGGLKEPGADVDYPVERVSAAASPSGVDHED